MILLWSEVEVDLLPRMAMDFDLEQWHQLGHLFSSKPRWPSRDVELVSLLLSEKMRENEKNMNRRHMQKLEEQRAEVEAIRELVN